MRDSLAAIPLEPWIDGLAFKSQHSEDALVGATQGFFADEALQRLDAQCKLSTGQRAFRSQAASAEPLEILWQQVLGTVDDAQVLRPTAFTAGCA